MRDVSSIHSIPSFLLSIVVLMGAAIAPSGEIGAAEVKLNGQVFTLPDGFDIELAAGPPLVDRPIVADFDEEGRLYVADSSGSNDKVESQLEDKPHRIVRLDRAKDGVHFEKSSLFANKLMLPEGAMWFRGSLYVAAPPSIWKFTETNQSGVADQRAEWFQGKTLTNCANDLHGPYLGRDGWIYWCKGAFAKQTYARPDGTQWTTRAAHIFRSRPDRSGIEPVMTGGMDNPVQVVFTPGGERIFSTTFLQRPGGGRRDGLIHAVYGGVYGKVHDVIDEHPRTNSDVMPVMTHLGPAAPCGLILYESTVFGQEYQGNLFTACFNLQKITRHVLTAEGATFTTRDEDFLVSDNKDFHPTHLLEDADGSLLVVDTGGWYKLCCPTSQLQKPDVLGAIYRVRRKNSPGPDDPRGSKLSWDKASEAELADRLGDPRPAVRKRAIETLAARGDPALPELKRILVERKSTMARCNAVWCATRIDGENARAMARLALDDPDETVRQAAIHSAGLWRDIKAVGQLEKNLQSGTPHNQRAVAEAFGRMGDTAAVPAIFSAAETLPQRPDRILEHSLTYALIEIANARETATGLSSKNAEAARIAAVALDQMPKRPLTSEQLFPLLSGRDAEIRRTAWWIAGRHPEWADRIVELLRTQLCDDKLSATERSELEGQLARLASSPAIKKLLAEPFRESAVARRSALRAMSRSGLKKLPIEWKSAILDSLNSDDGELAKQAVATLRQLPPAKEQSAEVAAGLHRLFANKISDELKIEALAALPGGLTSVDPSTMAFLRSRLANDQPTVTRILATEILAKAQLTEDQCRELTADIKTAGPLEIDRLLAVFTGITNDELGKQLMASIQANPARVNLRPDAIKAATKQLGPSVQREVASLLVELGQGPAEQAARLDGLLKTLPKGDVRRGQAVFNSQKAACAACHAIGYLGGNAGPDLTSVGKVRSERDLLEAIVFPSASFVRSYESLLVITTSGKVINGLVRKDTPDELLLATGPREEIRIAKEDIEAMRPGTVSIMPAGLDQQITPEQLADLVEFLKACR